MTYYGQLAMARLKPGNGLKIPTEPKPSVDQTEAFDRHELVRVVKILARLKQRDHLRPFILALREFDQSPGWQALTAGLAGTSGRPDLAVGVAKKAILNGTKMIEAAYPTMLPAKKPRRAVLEMPLVLAVIRQESAFDTKAISPAGARGLMQLLPRTARRVAKNLKLRYSRRRLTTDPAYNLTLGQAYLASLIDAFDGSYVLALAGYNAGPTRARQWVRANGDPRDRGVDVIDWIEMIPIGETRNYIQRVLEGVQVYRARLNHTEVALALERDLNR